MNEISITTKFTVYKNADELIPTDKKLRLKSLEAKNNAYAPYSKFSVGASILLENGVIIQGNNQENAAYPSGICAERVAIWNAASQYPEIKIQKIFISSSSNTRTVDQPVAPCGACRQSIVEYETKQAKNIEIYFTGETGEIIKANSINDLLPFAFNSSSL